jgi:deoxyribonuclease-4
MRSPIGARDELGAHVSTAGGVAHAPGRAAEIDSRVLQLFTKQPSRWAEPALDADACTAFGAARRRHAIAALTAHDSYLINLASPDPVLRDRSLAAFKAELQRCQALGVPYLVSHPGNAMGAPAPDALARNAAAIEQAIEETDVDVTVLLETTAGSGTALGARLEELAGLRDRVGPSARGRVGYCVDTCHVWAAGYDLRGDYDGVAGAIEDVLGLAHVRLFHLNDSVGGLGSRRDRHAGIGDGALGEAPFRALMTDDRFLHIPKVLETPKGADPVTADRRNLERLRGYRRGR